MNEINIKNKVISAAKWSTITEIASKLVTPITNMILARIVSPEAFGVVTTITMIMSFADMFTDAGFQKYLIQHKFKSKKEMYRCANIAFWTNLGISIFLWVIIIIFRHKLAYIVGNDGLGNVIAIACVQLLLTSFSSIQMALYRREFDFKTLFIVKIISILLPFIITIPLAAMGFSYWSIIIGSICMQLSNAIVLTVKSKWKPTLFYRFNILKRMLSFSIWSLVEAISIWFTAWIDIFVIGSVLDEYYLGIYKTSTTMVTGIMALITASVVPVLFSTLCRLQNNKKEFEKTYLKVQKMVSILVFPLGLGIFLYQDLATEIMLGNKWSEASSVVGVWALVSSITIIMGNFCSEAYRAKGKPKLSFIAQLLHLIVLVPACIISAKFGFWALVYTRTLIRLQFILIHFVIMKLFIGISVKTTMRNVLPTGLSTIGMGILILILRRISNTIAWNIFSIIMCSIFYFILLFIWPSMRKEISGIIKYINKIINVKNDCKQEC